MDQTTHATTVPSDDPRAAEFELGTSATWRFHGPEGLRRLSGPSDYRSDDPHAFSARLTRVQLDHVALETFDATAHSSSHTAGRIERFPMPLLSFVLVVEGVLHVELEQGSFDLDAGRFTVVDSRDPFTFSSRARVRMLKSVVGIEHIPAALQRRSVSIVGPLERTPLVDSFVAFASSILSTTASGRRARGDHLVQALADLQSAVLAEARSSWSGPPGPSGLRFRMEQYIEEHYRRPELDVTEVAKAMEVSVRQAHAAFDEGDRTIGRFIRDRRISAVALELRTKDEPVQFAYLAQQHGFGSADSLARAFRQRFGMTLTDYRSGGHRNFG